MSSELEALTQRYIDGTISAEEMASLNARLSSDAEARREFAELLNVDSGIAAIAAGWEAERSVSAETTVIAKPATRTLRPLAHWLAAAAVGVTLGLVSARWVGAFVSPIAAATVERLSSLVDGGFENATGPIPAGFPKQAGIWSGDEAEVVAVEGVNSHDGRRMLRFLNPGADLNNPHGRAISCDVFQIVDLRSVRASIRADRDAVLELSADFLDGRNHSDVPVTFICQMFLFSGSPDTMHQVWPLTLGDAVGSGATLFDSAGGTTAVWKTLTARCLVTEQADFAVVQLGVRPNGPQRKVEEQFVDRVQLTLRTQPPLPMRRPSPPKTE